MRDTPSLGGWHDGYTFRRESCIPIYELLNKVPPGTGDDTVGTLIERLSNEFNFYLYNRAQLEGMRTRREINLELSQMKKAAISLAALLGLDPDEFGDLRKSLPHFVIELLTTGAVYAKTMPTINTPHADRLKMIHELRDHLQNLIDALKHQDKAVLHNHRRGNAKHSYVTQLAQIFHNETGQVPPIPGERNEGSVFERFVLLVGGIAKVDFTSADLKVGAKRYRSWNSET